MNAVDDPIVAFHRLHDSGCFVMPNPWDVGSARALEQLGFQALATTSAGLAWTLGSSDGHVNLDQSLQHLRDIVGAVDVPVNADFEGGYAVDPADVAANVALAAETGIAGLSIEDSSGDEAEPLFEFGLAVERMSAARGAIDESGTGLVLTGRSEGFVCGKPDIDETIRRLSAYAEAGADCLYAPRIDKLEHVAAIVAAVALGVPVVVAEQNAVPGAANRMVGRFAKAAAVPFPGSKLPRAVVTGNPVRPEILAVDRGPAGRAGARNTLGLPPDRRVVAIFGGSLGALRLNNAVLGALGTWADRDDLALRHVVGERDWSLVTGRVPELPAGGLVYQPVRYDDRRELSLAAADLVVSRAGGNTVAELAAVGMPSVLVPLPGAPGDHQTANARYLADAGAAVLVADDLFSAARLLSEVDGLFAGPSRLAAMAAAASATARRDAAEAVAALVEAHAGA